MKTELNRILILLYVFRTSEAHKNIINHKIFLETQYIFCRGRIAYQIKE